ncbi:MULTISPECIES: GNAT family acetyltransferase [Hungatella]|uniref:GNAT family acetyltransferase n=1 Tax=Hungatella TaxID=1649459 RepID=UPI00210A0A28|nr:GNAT family acetyltransferase [Hungatella hathewayi]MCQ5386820.1 GNAT family acetyltransferase [Hungatella hathewayi]
MEAVKKESFVPMAFFKKEAYTGSFKGMRYRVIKSEDQFEAVVYPEPYCFEATPETAKVKNSFPFTDEGRLAVVDWLNEQYDTRRSEWDAVARC